ncbi:hypothetical protein [Prosthecobacter sp.]|uniref:hypothetical protein n=1 Tax=Prosthecobacter sp. TaxID=1965333 RepID=UPI003783FF17
MDTKSAIVGSILMGAALFTASGSENALVTVYQPLDPLSDGSVEVRAVPFVTGGAFPEILFSAITRPHIPQQSTPRKVGDINLASLAGISLECQLLEPEAVLLVFDFTKADPALTTEDVMKAVLQCVEKTAGKYRLCSRIVAGDRFPLFTKMIEIQIPRETASKTKEKTSTTLPK